MSGPAGISDELAYTAASNGWPQLRPHRTWGRFAVFATAVSTAIATWCFMIGGFAAYYLGAGRGTVAILAGSLLGIFFIVMACVPVCAKYGIDSVTSSRPQLGTRGSGLAIAMIYMSILGWNVILFIVLGRALTTIARILGWDAPGWFTGATGMAGIVVVLLVLASGPNAIRDFSRLVAMVVLVLGLVIIGLLVHQVGIDNLLAAPAVEPWDDNAVNWASAIEVLVASNLSWWAYTGSIVRNAPSARQALWPVVLGLGLAVGLGSLAGFYAGLAIPGSEGDPTRFLVDVGGPVVALVALAFIVLANVSTAAVGVYASTLAIRRLPGVRSLSWRRSTVLSVLPAFVLVGFFEDTVFGFFGTFLAFLGICFGPICGIQVVDYFVLRRQHYDVHALYDTRRGSPYHYWGGVNPVGLVAFACGVATYMYLLNPLTYESRPPFQFLTASAPAFVVAGLAYYVGVVLVLRPLGKGGYLASTASTASPVATALSVADESNIGRNKA